MLCYPGINRLYVKNSLYNCIANFSVGINRDRDDLGDGGSRSSIPRDVTREAGHYNTRITFPHLLPTWHPHARSGARITINVLDQVRCKSEIRHTHVWRISDLRLIWSRTSLINWATDKSIPEGFAYRLHYTTGCNNTEQFVAPMSPVALTSRAVLPGSVTSPPVHRYHYDSVNLLVRCTVVVLL